MNAIHPTRDLRTPLDDLIKRHGLIRVTLALLRAALTRKTRPPPVTTLSPHLLRDIGLDPRHNARR